MRLASRLATTGAMITVVLGGLLATPAQSAPTTSGRESVAESAPVTARSSGTVWCTKGLADCQRQRNYYLYLGCSVSPIRPAQWYPGWYQFDWYC